MGMSLPHIDKNEKSNYSRRGRSRFRIVRGPIFEQIPVTNPIHKDTFGFFQIWVGFCHLWGEEGFIWVLSYMGRVCHVWGEE